MRPSHDDALALDHPGIAGYRTAQAARLPADIVRRVRGHLRVWAARRQERAFLASLGEFELSRLGLTPSERDGEARKAFWKR